MGFIGTLERTIVNYNYLSLITQYSNASILSSLRIYNYIEYCSLDCYYKIG